MIGVNRSSCFLLAFLLLPCATAGAQMTGMTHGEMKEGQMKKHVSQGAACRGFVVLANDYAVMSGMTEKGGHAHGMKHEKRQHADMKASAMEHGSGKMKDMHSKMKDMQKDMGAKDHLRGLKHGDYVTMTAGALCVPLEESTGTWSAVSRHEGHRVTARSLKGSLDHNSRDSEAFELTVMQGETPVEGAVVQFIARMPHHDRSMKGGHGPANDPDGNGISAIPLGDGRYKVNFVDFSMGGSWLFEVRVKKGNELKKAYFASRVGEE